MSASRDDPHATDARSGLPVVKYSGELDTPRFVAKGWSARTMTTRCEYLLAVCLLGFTVVGLFTVTEIRGDLLRFVGLCAGAVAIVLWVLAGVIRYSRGHVALHRDRIEIVAWDALFQPPVVIPFAALEQFSVDARDVRFDWKLEKESCHRRITMNAIVAEDLFDHFVTVLEEQPEHPFEVDESGSEGMSVRRRRTADGGHA